MSLRNKRLERNGTQLCESRTINSGYHWGNNCNGQCLNLGGVHVCACFLCVVLFLVCWIFESFIFKQRTINKTNRCTENKEVLEASIAKFS